MRSAGRMERGCSCATTPALDPLRWVVTDMYVGYVSASSPRPAGRAAAHADHMTSLLLPPPAQTCLLPLLTSAGRSGGSARRPYDLPPPASSRTDLSPPSPHLGRQVGRQRLRQDVAAAARHRVQHVEREPPGGDEGLEVGRDRGRGRGRGRRRRRRHHDSRRRHQSLGSRHATPFAIGGAEGASTLKGKDDDDSTSCTTPTTPVWAAVKSQ